VLLILAELALVQQEEVNRVLWLVWEGRKEIVRVEKAAQWSLFQAVEGV
jgi:hypothetical protein